MRIRKVAITAFCVGAAALLAGGVGCGFDLGFGDDAPEDDGLIRDLVLLYEPPATATAAARPALTPAPTLFAVPPRPAPAPTSPPTLPELTPIPQSIAAAAAAAAVAAPPTPTPTPTPTPMPTPTPTLAAVSPRPSPAPTAVPAPPELTPIPQPGAAAATAAANPTAGIAGAAFENVPPSDGETYYYGEEIRVSFAFVEIMEVLGQPRAQLVIGDTTREAAFTEVDAANPKVVHFTYIVQSDDFDADGVVLRGSYIADADNYIRKRGSANTYATAGPAGATADVPFPDGGGKVDGRRLQPGFAATAAGLHLTYAPNQSVKPAELPAAQDGNGRLTYALQDCADQPAAILPDWLIYQPPGPMDDHGGRLAPVGDATPAAVMDAVCFILTVQDADGDLTDADTGRLRFTVAVGQDYDVDDDGLLEVGSAAQLDAIHWDLDGDGAADTGGEDTDAYAAAGYAAAFPNPLDGMGCPMPGGCVGYELTQNLDLDADYSDGNGWTPIGNADHPFAATLDGQGYAVANLSISRNDAATNGGAWGLFGAIGSNGVVRNLGLTGVSVRYAGGGDAQVGSIAGSSSGMVANCYASGAVTVTGDGESAVGGLMGRVDGGTVSGSYAGVEVSGGGDSKVGGLAGLVGSDGGAVADSYAMGVVSGGAAAGVGGLVGELGAAGRIANSYAVGAVSGGAGSTRGGLVGIRRQDGATAAAAATESASSNISGSYYDAGSTGESAADSNNAGAGKTTRELQSPTINTGIYQEWDAARWDFGTARQYPALRQDSGYLVPGQRQVALLVDNWDYPVVGEAVEVILDGDARGVSWQWQSSVNGAIWEDIPDAADAIYVPDGDDAAGGGKYLRAKVVFKAEGVVANRTTVNTARVSATGAADTGGVTFVPAVAVGSKLEYRLSSPDISAAAWRWEICEDAGMSEGCDWIPDGEAAYTPQAADVGKYLRAYVYYQDGARWQKATYPVIGPVAAAPSTP